VHVLQPSQTLLEKHKEDVKKVAERLLSVETISQHDIEELVGARPFATDVRHCDVHFQQAPAVDRR
jgi:hypothetical protein